MISFETEGKPRPAVVIAWVVLILGIYAALGNLITMALSFAHYVSGGGRLSSSPENWFDVLKDSIREQGPWILGIGSLLQWFLFLGLNVWGYARFHQRSLLINSHLLEVKPFGMMLAGLTAILVIPLVLYLGEIWFWIFPQLEFLKELDLLGTGNIDTPPVLIFYLFAIGITPAICEEMLFRGYLQQTLRRVWGPFPTVMFSGIFFALVHQNALGLLALLPVGLLLAFFYERFRSLPVVTVFHFCYNTALVLLAFWNLDNPTELSGLHPGTLAILSFLICSGLVFLTFRVTSVRLKAA